jgi:hypothetical protein
MLAIGAVLVTASPASAEPAPPGYRSDEILATAFTAADQNVPIRRGWYSPSDGVGFGFNKAFQRHNFKDLPAMEYVLRSPIVVPKSDSAEPGFNYTAYAQLRDNETNAVVEEVKVIAADTSGNFPVYYGSPGGNPLGLQTVYCEGYNPLCPDWASPALAGASGSPEGQRSDVKVHTTRSYEAQK